ncbi:unnamed protein product [Trichobilharzia szidati]|nr:unnamed protein product [Trichobilharzia szidati]
MFRIKSIEAEDINQAYEFTVNLFQHHYGTEMKSYLEKDEFERLFNIDFLKGLLLMYTPKNNNNNHNNNKYTNRNEVIKDNKTKSIPIGCMIYFIDISPLHGGYGIMLDQFFIISEFRRQGLGHMMMNRLCKEVIAINGSYIKLSYQEGRGLERFYTDLGFINHSHGQHGLHIFELYGKSQVIDFLHNYESEFQGQHEQEQKMSILTFPCNNQSSSSKLSTFLPSWCDPSTEVNDLRFPKAQIVIVLSYTKTNNCYELNNIPDSSPLQVNGVKCSQDELHNYKGMCIYVEQCYVCCWLGPMLNFTDFVGDLSILSKRYIWSRVKLWSQLVPELCGFVWEVPCGDVYDIDSLDVDCLKGISLAKKLIQLNVTDDTIHEGWNINYLDRKNIEILSGKLTQDFM